MNDQSKPPDRIWSQEHQHEYVRFDLAEPPQELVDEVRRKVAELPYTGSERIHWEHETKALLRHFLAWVEGERNG